MFECVCERVYVRIVHILSLSYEICTVGDCVTAVWCWQDGPASCAHIQWGREEETGQIHTLHSDKRSKATAEDNGVVSV